MTLSKVFGKAVLGAALLALPAASFAQVSIDIRIAPPVLPIYAQPLCPDEGYLWTPGYWAYGPEGYYWIPGTWVIAPTPGYLWTPAYWGYEEGFYRFHDGYWGPHIGFYGGVNYGFGYFGHGYDGGYWNHDRFFYNRAVNNINIVNIHNVYVRDVPREHEYNRVSYNGGNGGLQARPEREELRAMHDRHVEPTSMQREHFQAAAQNRGQLAEVNQGRPQVTAARTPDDFRNQGNNRQGNQQGNQQQHVSQGVGTGQEAPTGMRGQDNRNQVRVERPMNGGTVGPQDRQPVNRQQNTISNPVYGGRNDGRTDGTPHPLMEQQPQARPQYPQGQAAPPAQQPQYQQRPQVAPQTQYQRQAAPPVHTQPRPQAQPQQARPQVEARPQPQARPAEAPRQQGGREVERPRR